MNPRRRRRAQHRSGLRLWLVPMAILGASIAVAGFGIFYAVDHYARAAYPTATRAEQGASSTSSRR